MNKKRNTTRKTLKLERLEDRRLMAADIGLQDGLLSIEGTNHSDHISIDQVYVQAHIDGNGGSSFGGFGFHGNQHGTSSFGPQTQRVAKIKVTIASPDGQLRNQKLFDLGDVRSIKALGLNGNDNIWNNTGIHSRISGGNGNDFLRGGSVVDWLDGNDGDDVIQGGWGNDRISGNGGDDTLEGGWGNDRIKGDDGNDKLYGNNGHDTLEGGSGDDRLSGSSGNDTLHGDDGKDKLYGGRGNDTLEGGSGNDYLSGSSGNDTLRGDDGNDRLYGRSGDDTLEGGSGNDYLSGSSGNDTLRGDDGNDKLYGWSGDDKLYGGDGDDYLDGGTHNDDLYGGTGSDRLYGRSGDDGLFGGVDTVRDWLTGGKGDDRFLWDIEGERNGNIGDWLKDHKAPNRGSDATIKFFRAESTMYKCTDGKSDRYGSGRFTNQEIEDIDQALASLHHQTRNTKLLKLANGEGLSFERLGGRTKGSCSEGILGWNNDAAKMITFVDDAFVNTTLLSQVVFHEVGHNWDNENVKWNSWKKISGWRTSSKRRHVASTDGKWFHKRSTTFARDYGKTNPREDFATYFAKVMMDDSGRTYQDWDTGRTNTKKETFMDDFFASLT